MQKAVEHGADGSHVAKQFAPVFDWTIGRQQRAKTLVAAHDDFEQILGRGVWQLAHSKIVDNTVMSPGDGLVPGERVCIRAVSERGSARLLDGLTGIVVAPHPFARGWYKINLDPNEITPHNEWSAPGQELKRINEKEDTWNLPGLTRQQLFP